MYSVVHIIYSVSLIRYQDLTLVSYTTRIISSLVIENFMQKHRRTVRPAHW